MSSRFGTTDQNACAPDAPLSPTEAVVGCIASYTGEVVSASRVAPCTLARREKTQLQPVGSPGNQVRAAVRARSSGRGSQRPSRLHSHIRSAGGGSLQSVRVQAKLTFKRRSVWPNNSLNPRLATAGSVSLVRGTRCIIAYQAYAACLRSRG